MKITVEIVWHGFKEGHVVSIGVFGAMRPDARAASGGVELSSTLSITALFFVGAYK
jgi:hypothetical protein